MKSNHFLNTLKGMFFSFILLSFVMGCSKKTEEEVKPTPPIADFSFTPVNPKVNQAVTFNNTSTNAVSFEWTATGTNFSSTDKNPTFTFTTAGDFDVKLVAKNAAGETASKTTKISVAPADTNAPTPVAAFSFSPASPKTGEEVTFTNTSTNATSYAWSATGTNFSSTDKNPKFTFAAAGDFDVKLVAKNAAGQSNEIIKKVTVTAVAQTPAPIAAFSFSPANPKTGEEVTFTNASTNATSYIWSATGTSFSSTEANPKFTFDAVGDFDVKLVAKNAAGQTNEIIKRVTVTAASSGGNNNPCNLPECYVERTTTVSSGFTTTINYSFTTVNGKKLISAITTSTIAGNLVTSFQYDAQGKKIKQETKIGGTLQNYITFTYSNGDRTVRGDSYDASGTLAAYTIETYDANMRLTRSETYTAAGGLTGYTVFSDFLNTTGSFPQLVQTYNASNVITQTDVHTYQDCQLKKTVSKDGSGTLIGEVNNTIDARLLLRTSVATIYAQGTTITSNTQYVYDCD